MTRWPDAPEDAGWSMGTEAEVHRMDGGLPLCSGDLADLADLAPQERISFEEAVTWRASEGAYGAMRRTKP